ALGAQPAADSFRRARRLLRPRRASKRSNRRSARRHHDGELYSEPLSVLSTRRARSRTRDLTLDPARRHRPHHLRPYFDAGHRGTALRNEVTDEEGRRHERLPSPFVAYLATQQHADDSSRSRYESEPSLLRGRR